VIGILRKERFAITAKVASEAMTMITQGRWAGTNKEHVARADVIPAAFRGLGTKYKM
jgi:hypothetical protein